MEKRRILIADDEANLCKVLSAEFGKAGYSVSVARNGAEAVEQARDCRFDMVLLDVRMPVLDGFKALREIRDITKDTPIIVMSAYHSQDVVDKALSMGAIACVSKPFDLETVTALVEATLDEGSAPKSDDWSGSVRTVLFRRNQPVLVEVHEGAGAGRYQSEIEDKDEETLVVVCPSGQEGHAKVHPATRLSVGFAGEDAFYEFETTVLTNREGPPAGLVLRKPTVIYRLQRRKYPRRAARVPVGITLIEGDEAGAEADPFQGYAENIGVGGLKVVTQEQLPEGAEVRVRASDESPVRRFAARGRITRGRETIIDGSPAWEYGIQFTKMDDQARRALQETAEAGVPR